jgi:hypothetical protein
VSSFSARTSPLTLKDTVAIAGVPSAAAGSVVAEFSALAAREAAPIATDEAVPIKRFRRDISNALGFRMVGHIPRYSSAHRRTG